MIDPAMLLHIQMTITNPDGSRTEIKKPIAPINGALNALFKSCEVTFGATALPTSPGAMPYVQYLYSLLSYNPTAQNSVLRKSLWYRDGPGSFNYIGNDMINPGFDSRSSWVMNRSCDMLGPLLIDICKTSRLLLNRMNINIKLYRSSPQFYIMTEDTDDKNYRVSIDVAELLVRRVRPRPIDVSRLEAELSRHHARYPYVQNTLFPITMPANTKNIGKTLLQL